MKKLDKMCYSPDNGLYQEVIMCANNIKALRVASKKTQTQVARDLGVKLDRYRSWEQGKRNPTGMMGIKIAEYFGVNR